MVLCLPNQLVTVASDRSFRALELLAGLELLVLVWQGRGGFTEPQLLEVVARKGWTKIWNTQWLKDFINENVCLCHNQEFKLVNLTKKSVASKRWDEVKVQTF